ncbi:MarR family winged helix-turn-helix transcriptional regulator [Paenibacillus sp. 481]|uniref:MarR family winged helix-turn-helix transcriptional regulator n=1 Tax=Paenibacillus sp. 481 TaxID=2835869 RepID=UPI001E4E27BA|nr:MarR family transcriptional regulator [Paenibacillus sp. 481]UHA72468.1 MarR family transcriptional regulator [Paenibacillus sp. 481]
MTQNDCKEKQILTLLNGLCNKLQHKFEHCTGISSSRLEILYELCGGIEIKQSILQKRINIDNAAITRHLKQLEAEGMVTRRKNPDDNRETFVRLSDEGLEKIEGYKIEKENFIRQILKDFNDEEIPKLADFLERMKNNI